MESYEDAGFMEFSRSKGTLVAHVEGNQQSAEYSAKHFINGAGNIGGIEIKANDIVSYLFLSKTGGGDVLTIAGPEPGPVSVPIAGFRSIWMVEEGSPVEDFYQAHMDALGGSVPLSDPAWLKNEIMTLPQRAVDVMVKIFLAMEM